MVHGGIWPGDFERLLRRMNEKLRIIPGSGSRRAYAGLYYWTHSWDPFVNSTETRNDGNWRFVSGVPINWIPERTMKMEDGRIFKIGWREVFHVVQGLGLGRIPWKFGGRRVAEYGRPSVVSVKTR